MSEYSCEALKGFEKETRYGGGGDGGGEEVGVGGEIKGEEVGA